MNIELSNWKTFWQSYRLISIESKEDLLFQVGKTVNGVPISEIQYEKILEEIVQQLNLSKIDKLLDLACGNGLLTNDLSKMVLTATGIDFSKPFIDNAKKHCRSDNVNYFLYDIKNLNDFFNEQAEYIFNKVLIYDALAYFTFAELKKILSDIKFLSSGRVDVLLASVLNKKKKWKFFNTLQRKLNYFFNIKILKKNEGLGKWWDVKEFYKIGKDLSFKVKVFNQHESIHTSHYRINILLTYEKS